MPQAGGLTSCGQAGCDGGWVLPVQLLEAELRVIGEQQLQEVIHVTCGTRPYKVQEAGRRLSQLEVLLQLPAFKLNRSSLVGAPVLRTVHTQQRRPPMTGTHVVVLRRMLKQCSTSYLVVNIAPCGECGMRPHSQLAGARDTHPWC